MASRADERFEKALHNLNTMEAVLRRLADKTQA